MRILAVLYLVHDFAGRNIHDQLRKLRRVAWPLNAFDCHTSPHPVSGCHTSDGRLSLGLSGQMRQSRHSPEPQPERHKESISTCDSPVAGDWGLESPSCERPHRPLGFRPGHTPKPPSHRLGVHCGCTVPRKTGVSMPHKQHWLLTGTGYRTMPKRSRIIPVNFQTDPLPDNPRTCAELKSGGHHQVAGRPRRIGWSAQRATHRRAAHG